MQTTMISMLINLFLLVSLGQAQVFGSSSTSSGGVFTIQTVSYPTTSCGGVNCVVSSATITFSRCDEVCTDSSMCSRCTAFSGSLTSGSAASTAVPTITSSGTSMSTAASTASTGSAAPQSTGAGNSVLVTRSLFAGALMACMKLFF